MCIAFPELQAGQRLLLSGGGEWLVDRVNPYDEDAVRLVRETEDGYKERLVPRNEWDMNQWSVAPPRA